MKRPKFKEPNHKWLNPQKTKKLLLIAGILLVVGLLGLSYLRDIGILPEQLGLNLAYIILGTSGILLLIDTLAQDKKTKSIQFLGLLVALVYAVFRHI
jgi:uncharacterized membrane protein SirB2